MTTLKTRLISALGLAVAVVALGVTAGAGEQGRPGRALGQRLGERQGQGQGRGQMLANGNPGQHIENHIKRIEQLIANRPEMPADVKAALEKIVADLKVKQAAVEKLAADFKAGNKDAVEGDRAALRAAVLQLLKDRLALVDAHIAKVEARLAEHPDAPADVKAAVEKLVADMKDRKADLTKLIADIEAGNKDAIEADRDEMKDDRGGIRADLKAVMAAMREHRGERRGQAGRGEPK